MVSIEDIDRISDEVISLKEIEVDNEFLSAEQGENIHTIESSVGRALVVEILNCDIFDKALGDTSELVAFREYRSTLREIIDMPIVVPLKIFGMEKEYELKILDIRSLSVDDIKPEAIKMLLSLPKVDGGVDGKEIYPVKKDLIKDEGNEIFNLIEVGFEVPSGLFMRKLNRKEKKRIDSFCKAIDYYQKKKNIDAFCKPIE